MNRWAIVFRADGADSGSFERGEDFGNVGAVARREFSTRGLGQFFADIGWRVEFALVNLLNIQRKISRLAYHRGER